jgi:hypothetical protein
MNEYTFPFNTCEKVNESGVVQPYSAIANMVTCGIVFYFLLKTKNIHTFFLLVCILAFEMFHTFSHVVHIEGSMQINITHMLAYSVNIAMLNLFYHYTGVLPSNLFLLFLGSLIALDMYTFFNLSIVYYLISFLMMFISILFYYYPLLPDYIQNSIKTVFYIEIIVVLLFLNETCNCEKMLEFYPDFPYHIFIEFAGMYAFYVICSNFYKLPIDQ